jgi:hypothetical protein
VALNFHGIARFTEDLDLFLAPEHDNIERLKRALRSVFDDPEIEQITAADLLGPYPAIQYVPPEGTFHLETQRLPFGELTVSVASPRTLYRMKRGTGRTKDRADAELLRERFEIEDE